MLSYHITFEGLSVEDLGTNWASIDNPVHEVITKIVAGPVYELWAITSDGYCYRRLGMCDGIPNGTVWELIPDLIVEDATFGIYGPIAIAKYLHEIITLNGTYSLISIWP